jgi:hypothetical protein
MIGIFIRWGAGEYPANCHRIVESYRFFRKDMLYETAAFRGFSFCQKNL